MNRFFILALSLSLFCVACHKTTTPGPQPVTGGPRALIVGKWEMKGSDGQITSEFAADGTYILTAAGQNSNGTYKWLDDSTIEVDVNGKSTTSKVTVSQAQLTETTGSDTFTFVRAGATPQGAAASATTAAQALLVGTWWSMAGQQKVTMEFGNDGSFKTTVGGQTTNGTYKWLDDATLEMDTANKTVVKATVTQDKFTFTLGTEVSSFQRETATAGPEANATTAAPVGPASITQAVLANRTTPLTHTPIEVTEVFPTTQGTINAVVTVSNPPSGTSVRGVLTAVDTNNAQPPNTKVGEVDVTPTEGTQNVAFTFGYHSLPAGKYKVDIYLNGTLDKTLPLSLTKDATPPPAAPALSAASFGNCPKQASDEKPPGFTLGVTMAEGVDAQGKSVNPGRIFQPNASRITAVLNVENAPAATRISARWVGADLGGAEACNTQIIQTIETTVAGTGNPSFYVTPPAGSTWPEGVYRLEVSVNDVLATSTDYGVCDGPCKFQVPPAWQTH
jgi:hypothetical protein